MTYRMWKSAYTIALANRKFEIENYWKRTSYFWTIIAATFVAYGVAARLEEDIGMTIAALFGIVLACGWIFSNKASKFWQENWEAHVDEIEDCFSGPIYKTVLFPKSQDKSLSNLVVGPSPFSVSKVNQIISIYSLLIWLLLLVLALFPNGFLNGDPSVIKISFSIVTLVFVWLLFYLGRSSFYEVYKNAQQDESSRSQDYSILASPNYAGIRRFEE